MTELTIEIKIKEKQLTGFQQAVLALFKKSGRLTRDAIQRELFGTVNHHNFDRRIRAAINVLRNHGYVITSDSQLGGYQLTTDVEKVRHYYNEQIKRAKAILHTARKVRSAYGLKDQMKFTRAAE